MSEEARTGTEGSKTPTTLSDVKQDEQRSNLTTGQATGSRCLSGLSSIDMRKPSVGVYKSAASLSRLGRTLHWFHAWFQSMVMGDSLPADQPLDDLAHLDVPLAVEMGMWLAGRLEFIGRILEARSIHVEEPSNRNEGSRQRLMQRASFNGQDMFRMHHVSARIAMRAHGRHRDGHHSGDAFAGAVPQ